MRILITGGCGFLGSHLVEHFIKTTEAHIVVLDKLTYASNGYDRLRDICVQNHAAGDDFAYPLTEHPRVKILGCDLGQPITVGISQEIGEIDYVIHAAAESHVDRSIEDPMPFIQSNVVGTHHLLMWASARRSAPGRKISRIFCVSTDEVYGPAAWDHPGHDETSTFRPANPYAAAKAGGECIAMAYANTYGLPITIVNTMNLIGERQHFEKFVPMCIRKSLLNEEILIHADPTCTRSGTRFYLHCRNYANAIEWLLEQDYYIAAKALGDMQPVPQDRVPLKVHVAGEREISNLMLAKMIHGIVADLRPGTRPINCKLVDFHSSRPGHDLRYALDASMIRSMGWRQPVTLDASIRKTVEWYLRPGHDRWLGL